MFFLAFLPRLPTCRAGAGVAGLVVLGLVFIVATFGVPGAIACLFSGVFGSLLLHAFAAELSKWLTRWREL